MSKNPFKFGAPVFGEYYYPLPQFSDLVRKFLDSGVSVTLMGPRRFGKTSFALDTIRKEQKTGKTCLLIDTFNVTSHRDFLQQVVRALNERQTLSRKVIEFIKRIKNPKITASPEPSSGQFSWSLSADMASEKDLKELIQDALIAVGNLDEKVVVIIDEFQRIGQLDDNGWLEATIRTYMQKLGNTVFLFSGSRKSIIFDMFNDQGRPFYKSCQNLEMPVLGDGFTDWLIERFKSVKIECDREAIIELRKEVQDTPNYIQMACFHIVAAQNTSHVTKENVRDVLETIVKQNAYAFETLLDSQTGLQQRVLRLCAKEREELFKEDHRRRYEISSAAALATSIKSLKEKGILDEVSQRGKVVFDDPLFAIWLQMNFS